ncbi:hypothetical protein J3F83DRAFT_724401 [Trichoderma novae-zelandiae]
MLSDSILSCYYLLITLVVETAGATQIPTQGPTDSLRVSPNARHCHKVSSIRVHRCRSFFLFNLNPSSVSRDCRSLHAFHLSTPSRRLIRPGPG